MRATSFGIDAERYDSVRPGYPEAIVDRLTDGRPARVLDIGAGTGLAGRLFAARGCDVTAVEPDARMAVVARQAGLKVDVARIEDWESRGRRFDAVICAQAWWWLDREQVLHKIAKVLTPRGRLGIAWNAGGRYDAVTVALGEVYERVGEGKLREPMLPGGVDLAPDVRDSLEADARFGSVETSTFEWQRRYSKGDWLAAACTFGDVITATPDERQALLHEVARVLDAHGGARPVTVVTTLVTAERR